MTEENMTETPEIRKPVVKGADAPAVPSEPVEPMKYPEPPKPMSYPPAPEPMEYPEPPLEPMKYPKPPESMEYPELPEPPMSHEELKHMSDVMARAHEAGLPEHIGPKEYKEKFDIIFESKNPQEIIATGREINLTGESLVQHLLSINSDQAEAVARDSGVKINELKRKTEAEPDVEPPPAIKEKVAKDFEDLSKMFEIDESSFTVGDKKLTELQKLKAKTKPILDKLEAMKNSKEMKVAGYILLAMIIAFLLTSFGLLRLHTGFSGGKRG